jgi:Leucine-rich repeat (LRR) protein
MIKLFYTICFIALIGLLKFCQPAAVDATTDCLHFNITDVSAPFHDVCSLKSDTAGSIIGEMCNLKSLELSGARIREIPSSWKLNKLQEFTSYSNSFLSFPESLDRFGSLSSIRISFSYLTAKNLSLSEIKLGNLDRLAKLCIWDAAFSPNFTSEFSDSASIEALALIECENVESFLLSMSLDGKKNIQFLELVDCSLNEIPNMVFAFTNLKRLDVSGNQLTRISRDIGKMKGLEELMIMANEGVLELPIEIANLPRLKKLFIDGSKAVFDSNLVARIIERNPDLVISTNSYLLNEQLEKVLKVEYMTD